MLAPGDRKTYSTCFEIPAGYAFDHGVGTTYSLDLETLLFVPYCLASNGIGEPEQALKSPIALLEAIHRTVGNLTVFCEAGETNAPHPPSTLYGLLEPCIYPAKRRGGGLFHPKVWVLRFKARSDDQPPLLRVVVLSRNVTGSRAWDTLVAVEGSPKGKKGNPSSRPLAQLLRALPQLDGAEVLPRERAQAIEALAREVEQATFEAPHPFEGDAIFEAFGVNDLGGFRPDVEGDELLAISPFVSPATLVELSKLAPRRQLVSRAEELAKCGANTIQLFETFTISDRANSSEEDADPSEAATADAAPSGLHAKVLAVGDKKQTTWWLGSANLTDPVRNGSSVELLVRLTGKTQFVGIDKFRDTGFPGLLVPYSWQAAEVDPTDGSRSQVDKAKSALVRGQLRLVCAEQSGAWDLRLVGHVAVPGGVAVDVRPASLPAGSAWKLARLDGAVDLTMPGLAIESLTALAVFHLSAGTGDGKFATTLTLKLPIEDMPEERNKAITRTILKNRDAFLQYLSCLLADLAPGTTVELGPAAQQARGSSDSASLFGAGLLERLLRVLYADPSRLLGLHALVHEVRAGGASDPEHAVPPEFLELWKAVEPHLPIKRAETA